MDTKVKEYVNKELGSKCGAIIFEIGAHYGEDTLDMLRVFDSPKIYCFEPDPRSLNFLHKYFSANSIDAEIVDVALFNKNGESDFLMSYAPYPEGVALPEKYQWIDENDYRSFRLNNAGGSSLKKGHEAVKDAETVSVQTMRLDTWAQENNITHVDFIWVDVQGAEREVVEGGEQTLKNTSFVWIEYGETKYEGAMTRGQTIEFFSRIGFEYVMSRDNNMLFRNKNGNG